jgi:hypothetical protein
MKVIVTTTIVSIVKKVPSWEGWQPKADGVGYRNSNLKIQISNLLNPVGVILLNLKSY